jgi:hypothetical protein
MGDGGTEDDRHASSFAVRKYVPVRDRLAYQVQWTSGMKNKSDVFEFNLNVCPLPFDRSSWRDIFYFLGLRAEVWSRGPSREWREASYDPKSPETDRAVVVFW